MHYYTHNIGDFAIDTRGMTYEQIGIYITLIDRYASTESPLTDDWVAIAYQGQSKCLAIALLKAFFVKQEDGWIHARVHESIENCNSLSEKRRVAGRKGVKAKALVSANSLISEDGKQMQSNCLANACIPNTQYPIPKTQIKENKEKKTRCVSFCPVEVASGEVPSQTWDDWMTVRKAKRAPMTETAWERFKTEAEKAHMPLKDAVAMCATRGWTSFLASWLEDKGRNPAELTEEERRAHNERLAAEWAREQGYE